MCIDPGVASGLGFPRPHYTAVERERRWLCLEVPRDRVVRTEAITDLYVTGARLRLREARPVGGGAAMLRLTRKGKPNLFIYKHQIETITEMGKRRGPRNGANGKLAQKASE